MTDDEIDDYLEYEPESGYFFWRVARGRVAAGSIAGRRCDDGRIIIKLGAKNYLAHRLAWFLQTGEWPPDEIDHENNNPSDNNWNNLRLATRAQNRMNSRCRSDSVSAVKGVYFEKRTARYSARIYINGKRKWLGSFATAKEADAVFRAAERQAHGHFAFNKGAAA